MHTHHTAGSAPHGRLRTPLLLTALAVVLSDATVLAQLTPVVLNNSRGCRARVTVNGILDITVGSDVYAFENVAPFSIRTTTLSGGQVGHGEYWGDELGTPSTQLTPLSDTQCLLAWRGCSLPGVAGKFDLAYLYEVPTTKNGVVVRGRLENDSLPIGIESVGYRQYLAAGSTPEAATVGFTGAAHVKIALMDPAKWDLQHPFFQTGGYLRLGTTRAEHFLTTRTSETTPAVSWFESETRSIPENSFSVKIESKLMSLGASSKFGRLSCGRNGELT